MRQTFIFLLYRLALWLAAPFIVLYLALRSLRNPAYWNTWAQRFGSLPRSFRQTSPGAVWLHAVSVGEVISAATFLAEFRRHDTVTPVFVSVSTLAGREIAEKRLAAAAAGIFYAPLDFVFIVRRVLRCLKPALLVVFETEIWPNVWRETVRSGAALMVANGRISDKAFPKYERWRSAFAAVLPLASEILAQTAVSRERYLALGADPARTRTAGNLKYDFAAAEAHPPAAVVEWLARLPAPRIWIAASTMPPARDGDVDEDEVVLDAFEGLAPLFPNLLLMLVPRRPERFDNAAQLLARRGIRHVRRSQLGEAPQLPAVLLVDSMGELSGLFRLADVVFMGGTLAERGGHNILEPAFFDKPVIAGPHLENFPEIAQEFRARSAMVEIANSDQLAPAVESLLRDDARRTALGRTGGEIARANSGAAAIAVESALRLRDEALPTVSRSLPARIALAPLAAIWSGGTRIHRAVTTPRRLAKPVISIGSIAAGGAGKTPIAIATARLLSGSGREPAILTRGYRRQASEPIIVPRGGSAPVAQTGDEAQELIRSGVAAVGIGKDRHATAQLLKSDIFILDDGFQHWSLARDIDIAVVDTLDPFPGNACIPLGLLREPPRALARASAIVLSRCQSGRCHTALEREIRRHNPGAPIFRSRLEAKAWRPIGSGDPVPPDHFLNDRTAAFCGLGNPASFWSTLRQLGYRPVSLTAFPDHHRYSPADLALLLDPALSVLLTTEKDRWNLVSSGIEAATPRIYSLVVEASFEDPCGFAEWLESALGERTTTA
ncbi:MAG: tetraacyldisaccharide 4'-kinase [Bryobacteraceae bacterium]